MKTVLIYHEAAVLKFVFMKILFIVKIITNRQTFCLNFLLFVDLIVYHQNYSLLWKLSSSSKYYCVPLKSLFIMETIATCWSTWIVETTSKLKQWQILWGESVSATMMECFLISLLNYIWNINFFSYSFF